MNITFLFPDRGGKPCGANKIVYEYANRLANDGHNVHIVYAGTLFFAKKNIRFKLSAIYRYLAWYLKGYSGKTWFPLDSRIKEHWTLSLNKRHVPKSDIYICTTPYTAMYLKEYNIERYRKYYFIQGYENWGGVSEEKLLETYCYPIQKLAVAEWLQKKVMEVGEPCTFVPNGFDFNCFNQTKDIEYKDKFCVSMCYSPSKLKGCDICFRALDLVKRNYSKLHVIIFGGSNRPAHLPQWYDYTCQPNIDLLNKLYNESAIYIGASYTEGWGLTIGEAMACGCAVACTDNLGYQEMAKDNKTALLSSVGAPEPLADNIIRLIEDDELRRRIANQGYQNIQQFNIERSYLKFKKAINA